MKVEAFTVSEMTLAIIETTAATGKDPFKDRSENWYSSYSWFRTKMSQSQKRAEDRAGIYWTQPRRSNKTANFRYDREHMGAIFDQLHHELTTGRGMAQTLRGMGVTTRDLTNAEELLVDPSLELPTTYAESKRVGDAEERRRFERSPEIPRLRFSIVHP